jgi:hypothetical protein
VIENKRGCEVINNNKATLVKGGVGVVGGRHKQKCAGGEF